MGNYYVEKIEATKLKNEIIYQETLVELFGESIEWSDIEKLEINDLIKLLLRLESNNALNESDYDVESLSYAIQKSRSGIGLSAMTNFNCAFCGRAEMWGSTSTPKICKLCAVQMAKNIIRNGYRLEKLH